MFYSDDLIGEPCSKYNNIPNSRAATFENEWCKHFKKFVASSGDIGLKKVKRLVYLAFMNCMSFALLS